MGRKKKKKNKKKSRNLSFDQMPVKAALAAGERALESGKAREALTAFKSVIKREGQNDQNRLLLIRTYQLREEQLREKQLFQEADAIRKNMNEYIPNPSALPETVMLKYISSCADREAFDTYASYLSSHEPSSDIEQFLAHRLLKGRKWHIVKKLKNSSPLKKDAEAARIAIDLMFEGKWEEALQALKDLPRSSPFASTRLFCMGMNAFYRDDQNTMKRAFEMLPETFPLKKITESMLDGKEDTDFPGPAILWDGPVDLNKGITRIQETADNWDFPRLKQAVASWSQKIYPENPAIAAFFLIENIYFQTSSFEDSLSIDNYCEKMKGLLPSELREKLNLKMKLWEEAFPIAESGKMLSLLPGYFPDVEERNIAASLILVQCVEKNQSRGTRDLSVDGTEWARQLGLENSWSDTAFHEMLLNAIRLDPDNRKAYELLSSLEKGSIKARQLKETGLLNMKAHFQDDPWPCLELSNLYYSYNAFRKAENVLSEAMERAPHDSRVLDLRVLSLLVSVQKNIDRKKPHIALRDLEKAKDVQTVKTLPVVVAKTILFRLFEFENENPSATASQRNVFFNKVIDGELANQTLFNRLRSLGFLFLDLENKKTGKSDLIRKQLEKCLKRDLTQCSSLSAGEVIQLLTPPGRDYETLLPERNIARVFMRRKGKQLLSQVDNGSIVPLYDIVMDSESIPIIVKDIKKRVGKTTGENKAVLQFYLAVLKELEKRSPKFQNIRDVLDETDSAFMESLRGASRRIAKHARGPLKNALEGFEFDFHSGKSMPFPFPMPPTSEDDFPPLNVFQEVMEEFFDSKENQRDPFPSIFGSIMNGIVDWLDGIPHLVYEDVDECVDFFEELIDDLFLRGAPPEILREFRNTIMNSGIQIRNAFVTVSKRIEKSRVKVSRDLKILLFGKKQKTFW